MGVIMITKEKNKRNISIKKEYFYKYSSAKDIFDNSKSLLKNQKNFIKISSIPELEHLDLKNMKIEELKKLAYNIFHKYHLTTSFLNDNKEIIVSKSGINESIQKIYVSKLQRDLLKEHLTIFSKLGIIIENAILVNQILERKNRVGILHWNYYIIPVMINSKIFILEFEVRSMMDGENHYRIQRMELKKQATPGGSVK